VITGMIEVPRRLSISSLLPITLYRRLHLLRNTTIDSFEHDYVDR
jgi:hypothetical protein